MARCLSHVTTSWGLKRNPCSLQGKELGEICGGILLGVELEWWGGWVQPQEGGLWKPCTKRRRSLNSGYGKNSCGEAQCVKSNWQNSPIEQDLREPGLETSKLKAQRKAYFETRWNSEDSFKWNPRWGIFVGICELIGEPSVVRAVPHYEMMCCGLHPVHPSCPWHGVEF